MGKKSQHTKLFLPVSSIHFICFRLNRIFKLILIYFLSFQTFFGHLQAIISLPFMLFSNLNKHLVNVKADRYLNVYSNPHFHYPITIFYVLHALSSLTLV